MAEEVWHDSYDTGRLTPAVRTLMVGTLLLYVLQWVTDLLTGQAFTVLFGLSLAGLKRGFLWQLVTYVFVHGSLVHVLLNMLVLYFMGPETERGMGTKAFTVLYVVSGILGGVGWLLLSDAPWGICVGASGAVFGITGAFAALYPNRLITLLVFFVLPVTMRAWVLALTLALVELAFLLTTPSGGVAYAAHLAGGVAGYLYTLMAFRGLRPAWPRLARRARPKAESTQEIDRILDKVASEGMHSLTRRERETLDKAARR